MALTREAVAASRPNRPAPAIPAAAGGLALSANRPGAAASFSLIGAAPRAGRSAFPLVGLVIALVLSIPVLAVLRSVLLPTDAIWAELVGLTLPRYLLNTVGLLLGVGVGVAVVGIGAAWLVTMCRFPGRRRLEWALLLPMAVPAYLLAYTYADLLQYSGPVQSGLRIWFGWTRGAYWFPEIRSLGGAIVVMTAVLYPYVYLLARAAFLEQSVCSLEASRVLGYGAWRSFARVALPLARPALVGGVALALMEALADFGTVKHFEVDTFTTAIYLSWFGLGSPVGAAKLAAGLLTFVFAILALERLSRGDRRYHHTTTRYRPLKPYRLRGLRAAGALLFCALPVLVGFAIPGGILLHFVLTRPDAQLGPQFVRLATNSLALAAGAGLAAVLVAMGVAYGLRLAPTRLMRGAAWVATLGYAVPGSIVAVGILLPFGWLDNAVDAWARSTLGVSTGLLLSGTLFALLFAYLVRFLAVSFNAVESGLGRITPSMDGAARTLGQRPFGVLRRVHVPLMRGSVLTAGLLVFVDALKELPATIIIRPFNLDTLAIRVYQLASDERLAQASTSALAIVAVGIVPVLLLSLAIARSRPVRDVA